MIPLVLEIGYVFSNQIIVNNVSFINFEEDLHLSWFIGATVKNLGFDRHV